MNTAAHMSLRISKTAALLGLVLGVPIRDEGLLKTSLVLNDARSWRLLALTGMAKIKGSVSFFVTTKRADLPTWMSTDVSRQTVKPAKRKNPKVFAYCTFVGRRRFVSFVYKCWIVQIRTERVHLSRELVTIIHNVTVLVESMGDENIFKFINCTIGS